jgi:hypothetical protein
VPKSRTTPKFYGPPEPLKKYLVVALRCAPSPELRRFLAERCTAGPAEFHVLVPRAKRTVLVADPDLGNPASDGAEILVDDGRYDVAQARLDSFMRALDDITMSRSGEVLSGNIARGIRQLVARRSFDEVLMVGSGGWSERRWLRRRRDLAADVRRTCTVPVVVVDPAKLAA